MRGRYKTVLTGASDVGRGTMSGWMRVAPAIQAGHIDIWRALGTSSCSTSHCPTPPRCSPSQGAVSGVSSRSVSDPSVKHLGRDFPLLPVIVEMGSDAEGYSGGCQALFDGLLFLFELLFSQVDVLLFLLDASALPP